MYRKAKELALTGWVCNGPDGVHMEVDATEAEADSFCNALQADAPARAVVRSVHRRRIAHAAHAGFRILESRDSGETDGLQPAPDFAPCAECIAEMRDPNDRRHGYAFVTCTHCGPRHSIVKALPYDRAHTSMSAFTPCPACLAEYGDPSDRRFHSQTNSCPDCGMRMELHDGGKGSLSIPQNDIIPAAVSALKDGRIVAVKGVGGYLLLCDAGDPATVRRLRDRKHRPHKPLALLYPDMQSVADAYLLSEREREELSGPAAPILLLRPRLSASGLPPLEEIAPGLSEIGVMLPSAPLLYAVSERFGRPLVATSGNVSGSPIIHEDAEALRLLKDVADLVLTHDRDIVTPQDDSVMRITPLRGHRILLRRSRGFAPSLSHRRTGSSAAVFAAGALLKSSFTLGCGRDAFVSQYLGDTDGYEAQTAYRSAAAGMMAMFSERPSVVLADRHPQFFSTRFAEELGASLSAPVFAVPHHKAHAAAVLAENGMLEGAGRVLCIVWDGTGLGDDGNAWGGEFFLHADGRLDRIHHFGSFDVVAGDKMAVEPRLSALSLCHATGVPVERLRDRFTPKEWNVYTRLLGKAMVRTSSVGRIFDALSSILLGCDRQSYEGQAAMLLESRAAAHLAQTEGLPSAYPAPGIGPDGSIRLSGWMSSMMEDADAGLSAGEVAAKFHVSLASLVCRLALMHGVRSVACSGGVFQNALLVDLLDRMLPEGHRLLLHRGLPPNDESVSFGQLAFWDHDLDGLRSRNRIKNDEATEEAEAHPSIIEKNKNHVFGDTRTDKVH